MANKPCIQCGAACEIYPVQLGDWATLVFLRVCCTHCLFLEAYDFLYSMGEHKTFRSHLYTRQNDEDGKERDEYINFITSESLNAMREDFNVNPALLSTPMPNCIAEMFGNRLSIPTQETMRFTKSSKEQRIKWAENRVLKLRVELTEAMSDLAKEENAN